MFHSQWTSLEFPLLRITWLTVSRNGLDIKQRQGKTSLSFCMVSHLDPLHFNVFFIQTLPLLFKVTYVRSYEAATCNSASFLLHFDSCPPWAETFSSYSSKPTSPWFALAGRWKQPPQGARLARSEQLLYWQLPPLPHSSQSKGTVFPTAQLRTPGEPPGSPLLQENQEPGRRTKTTFS